MMKLFFIGFALFVMALGNAQTDHAAFEVARKGSIEDAKRLVEQDQNAFLVTNDEGFSPLILACYRGNNEVAKWFVTEGLDLNQVSKMGTALMAAVVKGNNEMIEFLLQNKAKVDLTDDNGTTALMYAAMFKNKAAVEMLLKNKANRTLKDKNGKTAFEFAVFSNDKTIINLLKM